MTVNKAQTLIRRAMSITTPIANRAAETYIMMPTGILTPTTSVALMNPLQEE